MTDEDFDTLDVGPCCICGGLRARVIVPLPRRAAVPGHGWGCFQCGLPMDGASAVLCDECAERYTIDPSLLVMCCRGYPKSDGRISINKLPVGRFEHDMTKHPEEER